MKGDFSRQTFNPSRHYAAVLQQQGRVQLDADWNEQQLLALERDTGTARDVIGPSGAPRVEPGYRINATGAGLTISRGHFYVDGLLCINDREDLPVTAQPDLPGMTLPTTDGVYLAYLEAWQRHETAAEQPDLREKALGGADTSTRLRTVAQVRLLLLDQTGANATCGGNLPEWNTLLAARAPGAGSAGRMAAKTAPEGVTGDPACVLPPSAGFKGLENQLYRVEIHVGGDRNTARFKWSRENGSVATPIVDVSGLVLTVENIGRDDKLAFAGNQWVEVIDDPLDLTNQRGELFKTDTIDPANRTVSLTGGTVPTLDPLGHRVLRRWDQNNPEATNSGVPLDLDDWITLEDGIQVHFEPGVFKPGDFWLIPARSSISIETGRIEWPQDAASQAMNLVSQGNQHHFARLGIFRRQGGVWSPLTTATADCREIFPPLTGITAADVSFDNTVCSFTPAAQTVQAALDELCRSHECQCTILIRPGDDVAASFAQLRPEHDALICFQAGDYRIPDTVVVGGRGHLRITGCGPATRLFNPRGECVLRFQNCPSVTIEHLQIQGGGTNMPHLDGALTFTDCGSVTVRSCSLSTFGFGYRRTACLAVRNSPGSSAVTGVRVIGCDFSVGHLQVGILLLNVSRSFVQDNVLRPGTRPSTARLLEDLEYRGRLRRNLLRHALFETLPAADVSTNASVTLGAHTVHFWTAPGLISSGNRRSNQWQSALVQLAVREAKGAQALFRLLQTLADKALLGVAAPGVPGPIRSLAKAVLEQDEASTGMQGIVIAGTRADDVQVINNTIDGFLQGVHIGVSHRAPMNATPDTAGGLIVCQNRIRIRVSTAATLERHGIFVGNFTSLQISGNYLTAVRSSITTALATDGIRIYGYAGARMAVRENHMERFDTGIAFVTRLIPQPHLWVIQHNFALNATKGVRATQRTGRILTPISAAAIVGIAENVPT